MRSGRGAHDEPKREPRQANSHSVDSFTTFFVPQAVFKHLEKKKRQKPNDTREALSTQNTWRSCLAHAGAKPCPPKNKPHQPANRPNRNTVLDKSQTLLGRTLDAKVNPTTFRRRLIDRSNRPTSSQLQTQSRKRFNILRNTPFLSFGEPWPLFDLPSKDGRPGAAWGWGTRAPLCSLLVHPPLPSP